MKPALLLLAALAGAPAWSQQQVEPRVPAPKYNDVMTAVVMADLPALQELLALGKWPDRPDSQGRTPLLVALEQGKTEMASALLAAGADPERSKTAARGIHAPQLVAAVETFAAQASVGATRR